MDLLHLLDMLLSGSSKGSIPSAGWSTQALAASPHTPCAPAPNQHGRSPLGSPWYLCVPPVLGSPKLDTMFQCQKEVKDPFPQPAVMLNAAWDLRLGEDSLFFHADLLPDPLDFLHTAGDIYCSLTRFLLKISQLSSAYLPIRTASPWEHYKQIPE